MRLARMHGCELLLVAAGMMNLFNVVVGTPAVALQP
jgi:hypothetical protein